MLCTSIRRFSKSYTSPRKGVVLVAMCLAVLLAQADTSVVNLAIQTIGQHFHASVSDQQWVLDGYNLAYACFC
jgi:hypothetical protein